MIRNKRAVLDIYKQLFKHFGPQGWWPASSVGKPTFPKYHPKIYSVKTSREKFEICIGAILTQNTAWTNVEKALFNLHKAGVMSPDKLFKTRTKKLASLIKPSGYFNQKAERLKIFAKHIIDNYSSKIDNMLNKDTSELREELLSIKGIGPETADSMMLYAGSHTVFVVDAYTMRLVKRLGWFKKPDYNSVQKHFENNLPEKLELFNEYHALIVALGKYFCKKKPVCLNCPLKDICGGK